MTLDQEKELREVVAHAVVSLQKGHKLQIELNKRTNELVVFKMIAHRQVLEGVK